jgi:hypothetical protein
MVLGVKNSQKIMTCPKFFLEYVDVLISAFPLI